MEAPALASLSRGQARLAVWMVLVAGVALSVAAWSIVQAGVERDARARFLAGATALAAGAQTSLRSYADLLLGLQGLFQAAPTLGRQEFDDYIYSLSLALHYPSVHSVSYARRVRANQMAKFAQDLRRDPVLKRRGVQEVSVSPPGKRAEYLVIEYTEPLHATKTALGFDLASDPERMAVVARARDTGMPTLSGHLVLQADPTHQETAAVMRLALYRKNAFTPDVERRREAFSGLANVTFMMGKLARSILSGENRDNFRLRIYDLGYVGAPPAAAFELYSNIAPGARQGGAWFEESRYLEVGQRRWELRFSAPKENFLRTTDKMLPWAALAAMLAVSLLLSGLIRSLAGSRERARLLALQMTAHLRESQVTLSEEKRRTQELIEALPNPIYFKGTDGRYLGVNKAWENYFGRRRQDFLGKTVHELYPDNPEVAERLHADDQAVWVHPGGHAYETVVTLADGSPRNAVYYKATFSGADGGVAGLIGTIVDITERKQAEQRLALEHAVTRMLSETDESSGILAKIIQLIGESLNCACGAYWRADQDKQVMACVETWSVASERIAAFAAASRSFGQPLHLPGGLVMRVWTSGAPLWINDVTEEAGFRRAALAQEAGLHGAFAFPVCSGNENLGVIEFFSQTGRSPDEALLQSTRVLGAQIGLFIARKQAEEHIRHLAHYDALTGLANRNMFNEYLKHALVQAQRSDKSLAVLFIDLDRFKHINDTLGHGAGDAVLKEVANRLRACLRAGDTIGRLGGDEFVVLLEDVPEPMHSASAAKKIIGAVGQAFILDAQEFHLTASVGISTYPADGEDLLSLIKNADSAMYRAKELGKNNYQFYSVQMNAPSA